MALPSTAALTGDQARFGDLRVIACRDQTRASIVWAPSLTRIHLADIAHAWWIVVDEHGINIAGQVWYTPIDVDEAQMMLICRKTRDIRPLIDQANQSIAERAA